VLQKCHTVTQRQPLKKVVDLPETDAILALQRRRLLNMTNTDKLVALGRFMIQTAPRFADDAKFNAWARVGQLLTEIGTPFGPALTEFAAEDMAVVREGAAVITGKVVMPELMATTNVEEGKRTRKARMTNVMRKPAKPKAAATKAKKLAKAAPAAKRGRGRPRKSV